jgi:hypothetical protein
MKVVFVSNACNPHQVPLAKAFLAYPDCDFAFLACDAPSKHRKDVGIGDDFNHLPFVSRYYEMSPEEKKSAEANLLDADVVLFGSGDPALRDAIKRAHKKIFYYMEHVSKTPKSKVASKLSLPVHFASLSRDGSYVLCASSYVKGELNKLGLFGGRCLYWGYFPEGSAGKERSPYNDGTEAHPLRLLYA